MPNNDEKKIEDIAIPFTNDLRTLYTLGENVAHHHAYQNLSDNSKLSLCEDKNNYVVHTLKNTARGLVGYILEPSEGGDVIVTFRGTKCFASKLRDAAEFEAPGHKSFKSSKVEIIDQVNTVIGKILKKNSKTNITVTFAGHSLGAADAQNAFAACLETVCDDVTTRLSPNLEANDGNYYSQIKKIRLMAYNSPGVTQEVADNVKKNAEALRDNGDTELEVFWLHAAADLIQQAGKVCILDNVSEDVAKVTLAKVYHKDAHERVWRDLISITQLNTAAYNTYTAHTAHYFKEDSNVVDRIECFNNSTEEGREVIHQKLMKKHGVLQTWVANGLQSFIGLIALYNNEIKTDVNEATIDWKMRGEAAVLVEAKENLPESPNGDGRNEQSWKLSELLGYLSKLQPSWSPRTLINYLLSPEGWTPAALFNCLKRWLTPTPTKELDMQDAKAVAVTQPTKSPTVQGQAGTNGGEQKDVQPTWRSS